MTTLNDLTAQTAGIIHIMVTSLCNRRCLHCCNNQYDLATIPYVTDEELRNAHTICITGGEPFAFTNPPEIAQYYKERYSNIKHVYVYSNASELATWLHRNARTMYYIDGISVSAKNRNDVFVLNRIFEDYRINTKKSNRLYLMNGLEKEISPELNELLIANGTQVVVRSWQEEFQPANDSIFRRV